MHKSYYENNIDGIRDLYETQGIEIPSYFNDVDSYVDYRVSQKKRMVVKYNLVAHIVARRQDSATTQSQGLG